MGHVGKRNPQTNNEEVEIIMGTKYLLELECAYCYTINKDVYYAPSSEVTTFVCENCRATNRIVQVFLADKNDKLHSS